MESTDTNTSAQAPIPQLIATETAATGTEDGQEPLCGMMPTMNPRSSLRERKIEQDAEQEVKKKTSRIFFHKKTKQPNKQRSHGLCLYYLWIFSQGLTRFQN